MKNLKIALTGATGFIGSNLVNMLKAEGPFFGAENVQLVAIQRPGSAPVPSGIGSYRDEGGIETLIDFFKSEKLDGVVHLASYFTATHTPAEIDKLADSNLRFPLRVLEAATRAGVPWFLNTGTFWQHYNDASYDPVNLYAASKQAFEDLARFYSNTGQITFCTLKLSDTYGPGDPRKKLLALLKETLERGATLDMSEGRQLINISYITDVVAAYLSVIRELASDRKAELQNKSFGVSAADTVSLRELVATFEDVAGQKLKINWGARPYRPREVMTPWTAYERPPGWHPQVSLREGIRNFLEQSE